MVGPNSQILALILACLRHACRFARPAPGTPRVRSESPLCTLMQTLQSEATQAESCVIAFTAVNCVTLPSTLLMCSRGSPFHATFQDVTFRILINLCLWREIYLRQSHRSNNCHFRLGLPPATVSELRGRSEKWSHLLVSL